MTDRRILGGVLLVCAGVQGLFWLWLNTLGPASFAAFVTTADSPGYIRVAEHWAQHGDLMASKRTLGYPAFLALSYWLGGLTYGLHVAVGLQLGLNLVLTGVGWRLLHRLVPGMCSGWRAVATLFCFWAGFGMALLVLTDFLAALCFALFVYGMLFWRGWPSLGLSGGALAFATLLRPTFVFVPIFLLPAAYLVRRITSPVPRAHLIVFAVASIAATGASIAYQYHAYGYLGPSSVVAQNIGRMLFHLGSDAKMTSAHVQGFETRIAALAGQPYEALSRTDVQRYAMQIWFQEFAAQPRDMLLFMLKTVVKYWFVPVESLWVQWTSATDRDAWYAAVWRPWLGLACLPIWCLGFIPPGGGSKRTSYYLLVMMFAVYLVGITAMNPTQGERIRFPVLVFILPIVMWNAHRVYVALSRGRTVAAA